MRDKTKIMKESKVIAAALIIVALASGVRAEEKVSLEDRMIGSSVKLMAKTYVLTTDLEKLKRKHVAQIKAMDDESFYAQYANTLGVVDEVPELRKEFGFTGAIDREQAVGKIAVLDKKKLCAMIDSVPDSVIARRFKRFMGRRLEEMKGMDLSGRIQYAWRSLVGRLEK